MLDDHEAKNQNLPDCLFFFLMKENHFGNILGNNIYLTLAPDVFSYLFLSLPFCCRKPLEPL